MDHEAHFGTLEVVIRNISSSRCQMFFKIGVLQNFAIFTGKPCPPEQGKEGGGREGVRPPQRCLLMCTFLPMSPLNLLFSKEVTKNVHENQQTKSRAS